MAFVLVWVLCVLGIAMFAFWEAARAFRSGVIGGKMGWRAYKRAENPVVFWMTTIWMALAGCGALAMLAYVLAAMTWKLA